MVFSKLDRSSTKEPIDGARLMVFRVNRNNCIKNKYILIEQQNNISNSANWDSIRFTVSNSDAIPENLKNRAFRTYSFLEQELGKDFLLSHMEKGHPLYLKIFNTAPWQVQDLCDLAECIMEFKSSSPENYQELYKKLISRERCDSEGLTVLELLRMMQPAGFKMEIEPKIEFNKKPDIKITHRSTGEAFYGELTRVFESADRKTKTKDHLELFVMIEMRGTYVHFGCQQKAPIPTSELTNLQEFINQCKQEVLEQKTFKVFENDYLLVGFADDSKLPELRSWINKNNLDFDNVVGLGQNYDETKRIINNKINEKAKQIPSDCNGVIFIKVDPNYFDSWGPINSIKQIPSYLRKYDHILGIVIYSFLHFRDNVDTTFKFRDAFWSFKNLSSVLNQYVLFIENPSCKRIISDKTYQEFKKSLS